MANSSDWAAQLAPGTAPELPSPSWVAAMGESAGFVDAIPLGAGSKGARGGAADGPSEGDAIAAAFAEGETAGRAAAEAEAAQAGERARNLRLAFRELDQAALDALAGELSETVLALCEQVIAASAIDREALMQRCEEAARRIGLAAKDCTLHLHPDDIAMLGDNVAQDWRIEADAEIEPGGLRLEGADGAVRDGPREWRRAIAAALAS